MPSFSPSEQYVQKMVDAISADAAAWRTDPTPLTAVAHFSPPKVSQKRGKYGKFLLHRDQTYQQIHEAVQQGADPEAVADIVRDQLGTDSTAYGLRLLTGTDAIRTHLLDRLSKGDTGAHWYTYHGLIYFIESWEDR